MSICLYSTEVCPKCKRLKEFLESKNIIFSKMDMNSPEGMTNLVYAGIFCYSAPVLQADNIFLTPSDMFQGTNLKEDIILKAVYKGV